MKVKARDPTWRRMRKVAPWADLARRELAMDKAETGSYHLSALERIKKLLMPCYRDLPWRRKSL